MLISATWNNLTGNTANNNHRDGTAYLQDSSWNNLTENVAIHNQMGFYINRSDNNTFIRNNASLNTSRRVLFGDKQLQCIYWGYRNR